MRVLMLVATPVATDTRVLREATTLAGAGHTVHVVGRAVPEGFVPPGGVTVSSVGISSALRRTGTAPIPTRRRPPPVRLARWLLLPEHRRSAFGRWAAAAVDDAATRDFDVVHAHDFTALAAGSTLADGRRVPLVYDTHELWTGRPREHRPTPLQDRRERRLERRLGDRADAVLTVGDGVAAALRGRYG
ncbi:MAG TPA: glycosyltransferase, partial [Ornithinimicrobium sp.]|nr:glycosyltransferase [Ornithinimicrobium sp.]